LQIKKQKKYELSNILVWTKLKISVMRLLILFFILGIIQVTKAQVIKIQFGKPSLEEFNYQYENDPEMGAVVLYDQCNAYFDVNTRGRYLFLFYERIIRIKILNEKGLKYALLEKEYQDYYFGSQYENIFSFSAHTLNLDENNKIVKSKVKSKDYTEIELAERVKKLTIQFPEVKVGSIIELKYKQASLDLQVPETWYFQREIPVLNSRFSFCVPQYYNYQISFNGPEELLTSEKKDFTKSFFVTYYKNKSLPASFNGTCYSFSMQDVPPLLKEPLSGNLNNYRFSVRSNLVYASMAPGTNIWNKIAYALMMTLHEDYDQRFDDNASTLILPSGYVFYNTTSWIAENNKLLKSNRLCMPLMRNWPCQDTLKKIIGDKTDSMQILKSIYSTISNKMKWNGEKGIFLMHPSSEVYLKARNLFNKTFTSSNEFDEKSLSIPFYEGKGSAQEKNLVLYSLLKKSGFKCYPVLLRTSDSSPLDTNVHTYKQFNYVLVLVEIDKKSIFLDANSELASLWYLNYFCYDQLAWILRRNNPKWIKIKHSQPSIHDISNTIELREIGKSHQLKIQASGYEFLSLKNNLQKLGKNKFQDSIIASISANNINLAPVFKNINWDESNVQIDIEFNTVSNYTSTDSIVISPIINNKLNDGWLPENKQLPAQFDFPFTISNNLKILLPSEYVVSGLPRSIISRTKNLKAEMIFHSEQKDGLCFWSIQFKLKDTFIEVNEIQDILRLFESYKQLLNKLQTITIKTNKK